MTEEKTQDVKIGDRTITVGRFSTFKAIHAGELISAILREVPDLSEKLSTFGSEYRSKNAVRISRAAAELRYPPEQLAQVSEAAWEASGGYIEIPAQPGALDIAGFVLPVAFDASRDRVLELLALIVVPNSELRKADEQGRIKERLDDEKKFLLHSDLGEMVDLLVAATDVLQAQFEGKAGKLRAAMSRLGFQVETPEEEATTPEANGAPSEQATSKPTLSIASAEPTDGNPESPSTGSGTGSPSTSSTA